MKIPTAMTVLATAGLMLCLIEVVHGQDAAQPNVDLTTPEAASPAPTESPANPAVPNLSELDQAFKQSSLGKAADEYRTRLEWRKLENQVANDPAVVAAKQSAETAPTDLEKRQRLRSYYEIYYAKMERRASPEMKTALEQFKDDHLRRLSQPRVRPEDAAGLPTPTPTPKGKDKKKDKGKYSKFRPGQ